MSNKLLITRNIQLAFDEAKNTLKIQRKNGKIVDCSPENLARILVFAKDVCPVTEDSTIAPSSRKDDEYKEDVYQRASNLVKSITYMISYPKTFTNKWCEKIIEWTALLEKYTVHEILVGDVKEKIDINLQINYTNLKQALNKINQLIKNFEQGDDDMLTVGTKLNDEVFLVSNEYLAEEICGEAPDNLKTEIDIQTIYNVFPELLFIKGDVVVLPFIYYEGNVEVDMLLVLLKHVSDTGFDKCTIGIVDYDFDEEQYITYFEPDLPSISVAKYIQELLNNKNITYINPKCGQTLINFVKC